MSESPFIGGLMLNVLPVKSAEWGGAKQFSPLMAVRWQGVTHALHRGKLVSIIFKVPASIK